MVVELNLNIYDISFIMLQTLVGIYIHDLLYIHTDQNICNKPDLQLELLLQKKKKGHLF